MLAPRNQTAFPDEPDDLTEDQTELAVAGEDTEDGIADSIVSKAVGMLPSSIGLTFTVDGDAKAIKVTARWGSYKKIESETLKSDTGAPQRVWKRIPVEGISEPIPLAQGKMKTWVPCPDYEDVTVQGIIRRRNDQWMVTIYLVNGQMEPRQNKDEAWVFQAELIVESPDDKPIFLKRDLWHDSSKIGLEDQVVQMVYRKEGRVCGWSRRRCPCRYRWQMGSCS